MTHKLPVQTVALINHYHNLKIGSFRINCPYFENTSKKFNLSVFVGKGTPTSIEMVSNILRLIYKPKSKEEMLSLMIKHNIGIDCSGLAVRIIDSILKYKNKPSIVFSIAPIKTGFLNIMRHFIRTYTNISANTLTSDINCISVNKIDHIRPGDLIRVGEEHVGIITSVSKNHKLIKFVHSTSYKNKKVGVNQGIIKISNSKLAIEKQNWIENPKNLMLEQLLNSPFNDRGLRRIRALI